MEGLDTETNAKPEVVFFLLCRNPILSTVFAFLQARYMNAATVSDALPTVDVNIY